jgi:F0F1-type ATP synthase membrane subunit a
MADVPINESVPRGFASLIEAMMDALRTGVVKPVLEADTDRFMPFLWTVFFFILINNLLGMVPLDPFFSLFGLKHVGGTATGNVNVTAGLALCAFAMIHFSGTREVFEGLVAGTYGHHDNDEGEGHSEHGHDGAHRSEPMSPAVAFVAAPGIYLFNFAPHVFPVQGRHGRPGVVKRILMLVVYIPIIAYGYRYMFLMFGVSPAAADVCQWVGAFLGLVFALNASGLHPLDFVDAVMWGFLFFLECIGAVVKPFALCMRLFANMIAGHIVLGSILLLLPVFKGLTIGYFASSLPITLGCVLLSGLELFVAFLQAYIFMFLTTMFIGAAVHPEH